jgi:nitroreductase
MNLMPRKTVARALLDEVPAGPITGYRLAPRDPGVETPIDEDVLRSRRSVRSYAPRPVPFADLERVVLAGQAAVDDLFGAATPAGAELVAIILRRPGDEVRVRRAQRWAPGPAFAVDDLATTYADAPALVFICGDLAAASDGLGSRGYPNALVRAGCFGYAAWLAGIAGGLSGCVFGRSYAPVTRLARSATGRPLRHLFTLTLGWDASAGEAG